MNKFKCLILSILICFCGCNNNLSNNSLSNDNESNTLESLYDLDINKITHILGYNFFDEKIEQFKMNDTYINEFINSINVEYEHCFVPNFQEKKYSQIEYALFDGVCYCKNLYYIDNYIYFTYYWMNDNYDTLESLYRSCNKIYLEEKFYLKSYNLSITNI